MCVLFSPSSIQAALKQLAKNKVPNMAVLLKSIIHTHADAKAVFKDPTGSTHTHTRTHASEKIYSESLYTRISVFNEIP